MKKVIGIGVIVFVLLGLFWFLQSDKPSSLMESPPLQVPFQNQGSVSAADKKTTRDTTTPVNESVDVSNNVNGSDVVDGNNLETIIADSSKEDQQGRVRVFGRVVQAETGEPIANARVYLLPYRGALPPREGQVFSNANGEYAFESDLSGGYMLYAAKEPLLSFSEWEDLKWVMIGPEDTDIGPVNLKMETGQGLGVRVVHALSGKPIPDARILARGDLQLNFKTNDEGLARISVATGIWSLDVSASGFVKHSQAYQLIGNQQDEVAIKLQPAGMVFGTVADRGGLLLEDVLVQCIVGRHEFEMKTDTEGAYFFDELPLDQSFTLYAAKTGYREAWHNWQRFRPRQNTKEFNMTLDEIGKEGDTEPLQVIGTVTDDRGSVLPGATLLHQRSGLSAQTNKEGRFVIDLMVAPRERVSLLVSAPGFSPKQAEVMRFPDKPVSETVVMLEPEHWLSGKIVDVWGAPLPRVAVRLDNWLGDPYEQPMAFTDLNGLFRLERVPKKPTISASLWGYDTVIRRDLKVNSDQNQIEMAPRGVLFGKVVAGDSKEPVNHFNIRIEKAMGSDADGVFLDPTWAEQGVQFWSSDGSFHIHNLPLGIPLKLTVSSEQYPAESFIGYVARFEEEQYPIELQLSEGGQVLAGRLVDRRGLPRANTGLRALVYDPNDPYNAYFTWTAFLRGYYLRYAESSVVGMTDANGFFRFEGLPEAANLDLLIDHEGVALHHLGKINQKMPESMDNLKLEVPDEAVIHGSLNWDTFETAKSVELTSKRNNDFSMPYELDMTQDDFRIGQIPSGHYQLSLIGWTDPARPKELTTLDFFLESGEQREIKLGFN